MTYLLSRLRFTRWLALLALLVSAAVATAAAEPSLQQVYEAAGSGRLDQAQQMMQQVLVAHPNSAKAHFVQAELSARQGHMARAREELAIAEKLAPGLPFAKAPAVASLRTQLAGSAASAPPAQHAQALPARAIEPAPAGSGFPWGTALVLGLGVIAVGMWVLRRMAAAPVPAPLVFQAPASGPGGLAGPQSFGMAGNAPSTVSAPVGGSGMGGRVLGGLATGLAVGAGVMAAQAIGRSILGDSDRSTSHAGLTPDPQQPPASNYDMGGQDFGVNDTGSWDDGSSSADAGGGADWDS